MATRAAASRSPTWPRPRRAAVEATEEIQPNAALVGRWMSAATCPPTRPAGRPATRPHTITGPATGTASRLAGMEAMGTPPKMGTSTGVTPAWAASVTASVEGSRRSRSGPKPAIPAQAATDSRNPTEPASSGSISTSATTATARSRTRLTGRPTVEAVMASAAMATALNTDGSHRVNTPKASTTPTPATSRARSPSRRNIGPATASTKATFCPETANRWLSPAARKSSTSSGDCSRSSPSTRPVNNARRSVLSEEAPRTRVRRNSLVNRLSGPPGCTSPSSSTLSRLPMCRRARYVRLLPVTGPRRPRTVTRSPASRSARAAPVDRRANACTRLPPSRNSARTPPCTYWGSLTSVALAVTNPLVGAARTPSQARAPSEEAKAMPARQTASGRRSRASTSTTPASAPTSGRGQASQAANRMAAASVATCRSLTPRPAPWTAARPASPRRCRAPPRVPPPTGSDRAPGGRR